MARGHVTLWEDPMKNRFMFFEYEGRTYKVGIPSECLGSRSTITCCNILANLYDSNRPYLPIHRDLPVLSNRVLRMDTRLLEALCIKLINKGTPENPVLAYIQLAPAAIVCADNEVARINSFTVPGLTEVSDGETFPVELTEGTCVDMESESISHVVQGGQSDCIDVPRIILTETDNVIYAWFIDENGFPQSVIWAEVRSRRPNNIDPENSLLSLGLSSVLVQKWHTSNITLALIWAGLPWDFEVCIFAKNGIDTTIMLRLGKEGEESWPLYRQDITIMR